MTTKAPAPFAALCDAPMAHGGRCGLPAWRTYPGKDGLEHGFCVRALHAWSTVERYPTAEDAKARVPA